MKKRIIAIALALVLSISSIACAGSGTFIWDAVNDPELSGYRIHIGDTSGDYIKTIDVGNVTEYTFNTSVGNHVIAVTAYAINDPDNLYESSYSDELSTVIRMGKPKNVREK